MTPRRRDSSTTCADRGSLAPRKEKKREEKRRETRVAVFRENRNVAIALEFQ
jgi:hypothetical protein